MEDAQRGKIRDGKNKGVKVAWFSERNLEIVQKRKKEEEKKEKWSTFAREKCFECGVILFYFFKKEKYAEEKEGKEVSKQKEKVLKIEWEGNI